MNYIILDLEWDSAYYPKCHRFINQILQIGAVKLNESFEVVDTFDLMVRSSFSDKVTKRFTALTGITTEQMLQGTRFDDAVDSYNNWVGNDTVTMTWSNSDLFTMIENEENLLSKGHRFRMEKYLDLQKFIQGEMRMMGFDIVNQVALGDAAALLRVSTDNYDLHTAKDDSLVCAGMLKKCYNKERFESLICDTSNPEFYKRLKFKPYAVSDINDSNINRSALKFSCEKCGGSAQRLTEWRFRNRWFSANFVCKDCGEKFIGRVMFKKTYDDVQVRRRICKIKPKVVKSENEVQSVPETV